MTENGWQTVGRIAKDRRERLGLRQNELAARGGPGVSTVGKFERGQGPFPLRTQHQMERALGWSRTVIEQVVNSIDSGQLSADDWEHDLVEEDIPDMSATSSELFTSEDVDRAVSTVGYVLTLVRPSRREAAIAAALQALLPFLDASGATTLGQGLRDAFPPNPTEGGDGDADANSGGSAPTRKLRSIEVDEAAYDPGEDDDKK